MEIVRLRQTMAGATIPAYRVFDKLWTRALPPVTRFACSTKMLALILLMTESFSVMARNSLNRRIQVSCIA
jgi:hypothetical protein